MFKYVVIFLLASESLSALTTLHVTVSTDNNPGGKVKLGIFATA